MHLSFVIILIVWLAVQYGYCENVVDCQVPVFRAYTKRLNMTLLIFTVIIFGCASIAGLIGSLTGLGGGVVLIPLLTLVFKVDIHYAIGTSLISVIATSSGAAAAYVKESITNIRQGMVLELATTIGALTGAFISAYVSTSFIAIIFGIRLAVSAITSSLQHEHLGGNFIK